MFVYYTSSQTATSTIKRTNKTAVTHDSAGTTERKANLYNQT